MDGLNIISTYLPLFSPVRNDLMSELKDIQKTEKNYDALSRYYIEKMKKVNTTPIEMMLDTLFQLALNIEEAVVDHGKDAEGNAKSNKVIL
jgi:hypothetical protein